MPKPIFRDNNLVSIINDNVYLLNQLDIDTKIESKYSKDRIILNSDNEQLNRVFLNLIKNSIESIQEKKQIDANFKGKINIEIIDNDDYIKCIIIDNGNGFDESKSNIKNIFNPYFTTKEKGTGLGLAIVNKIVNDHDGRINFMPLAIGAKIIIRFTK